MTFQADKDLAFCGLACVLCSIQDCPGCKARGCINGCDCSVYKCAMEKGIDGCYLCKDFPCEEKMLQGLRDRAFNQYARQFGKQALLKRLYDNSVNGIAYHKAGGLQGDYDMPESEEEIMQLIQFGRNNPYLECPVFETEHFGLRLVSEADAEDLLICYGDPKARRFFNNDGCPPGEYDYSNRMQELLTGWIHHDYANGYFIRFTIVEKQTQKAIGTIEIYDRKYQQTERTTGILRIDIAPAFERKDYLFELMKVSIHIFFNVFHVEKVIHKAIPEATERISALLEIGFQPVQIEGREHYWIYSK